MFDCVLVTQTIHLMIQRLRLTSLNQKKKKKKEGKDEGKRKIYETSCNLCSVFFLLALGSE